MPKFDITPEKLRELYIDQGLTAKQIAEQYGTTYASVTGRLSYNGIHSGPRQQTEIPIEHLRELYIDKLLTKKEIGATLGCSAASVGARLAYADIKRTAEQNEAVFSRISALRRGIIWPHKRKCSLSDESLRCLYIDESKSAQEIADREGASLSLVCGRLKRLGISKTSEQISDIIRRRQIDRSTTEEGRQHFRNLADKKKIEAAARVAAGSNNIEKNVKIKCPDCGAERILVYHIKGTSERCRSCCQRLRARPLDRKRVRTQIICPQCGKDRLAYHLRDTNPPCLKCSRKIASAKGENHPNWKGGVTKEYHAARTNVRYREWQDAVLKRDGYTCRICRVKKSKIKSFHCHHIEPFATNEALRYEVSNGVSLCKPCHTEIVHRGRGSMEPIPWHLIQEMLDQGVLSVDWKEAA